VDIRPLALRLALAELAEANRLCSDPPPWTAHMSLADRRRYILAASAKVLTLQGPPHVAPRPPRLQGPRLEPG